MDEIVARARALVGCRYRPQGRDPRFGLDCVGVICRVFDIPVSEVPRNYRLRRLDSVAAGPMIQTHFTPVDHGNPGDLLLLSPARDQLHLAVLTDRGFVHADAGLRQVVETPGRPVWPVVGRFRRKPDLTG